jgi:hypothetical protein
MTSTDDVTRVEHHYAEKSVVQVERDHELDEDTLIRYHALRFALDARISWIPRKGEADEEPTDESEAARFVTHAKAFEAYLRGESR